MTAKVNLLTAAPDVMKAWSGASIKIAASLEPSLVELQRTFGAAGPVLLVGRTGADRSTIALPGDWARSADDAAYDLARPHAA